MSSDWKQFEIMLYKFEKLFKKIEIWPTKKKFLPIRYAVLSLFITFCVLLPVKVIFDFEAESIMNGIVNEFGCLMAIAFTIRLIISEESFLEIVEFIKNDLKEPPSLVKKEILTEITSPILMVKNFVIFLFPLAIVSKLSSPFLEYGYRLYIENDVNATITVPPPMALPLIPFVQHSGFIVYVMEIGIRTIMLCWLMAVAIILGLSSLYLGGQMRVLAKDLEKVSIDDKEIFEGYIRRHEELLRITTKLTKLFNVHIIMEVIVSYINLAVLFLSMFGGTIKMFDFLNDMMLTLAGGSQFALINYFGEVLTNASITVYYGAYNSDWIGKSIVQQKKLAFMIARARKPCKLCVADNFIIASLEFMMNLVKDSYAAYNILKTTMAK